MLGQSCTIHGHHFQTSAVTCHMQGTRSHIFSCPGFSLHKHGGAPIRCQPYDFNYVLDGSATSDEKLLPIMANTVAFVLYGYSLVDDVEHGLQVHSPLNFRAIGYIP